MNTKWSLALALAAVSSSAFAQQGPPPGGPPPPRGGGMGRRAPQAQAATTETARLLSLRKVQNDLGLRLNQLTTVGAAVRSLSPVTEDQALAVVSRVLTATQAARLKELLVQDLGYGSLAIADVRAQLSLAEDQARAMAALLSTLETTKKALATAERGAAQKATVEIQAQTNAALAKLLTAEQDKKLRGLAGRALPD